MTSLSNHGYKIKKKDFDPKIIKECKDELTVKPFTTNDFGNKNETKFSLFLESPGSLYIPRFFGQDKFGNASKTKLEEGEFNYKIERRGETWISRLDWAKKVVWYANKKGAYLYGSKAMSKYYSAHH